MERSFQVLSTLDSFSLHLINYTRSVKRIAGVGGTTKREFHSFHSNAQLS